MKTAIIILKHIFVPLSAFSFLILGLLACFFSAIVEFFVLKEFLAIPGAGINPNVWTALLVLILEGSKLTLHFYYEALKAESIEAQIQDFNVASKRKLIYRLKTTLTAFSIGCTIICIVNALYQNSDLKIQTVLEENRTFCETRLTEEKARLLQEKDQAIAAGISLYESTKTQLDNLSASLKAAEEAIRQEPYIKKRNDLQDEAQTIRAEYAKINQEYTKKIEQVNKDADAVYQLEFAKVEAVYGENGSERMTDNDLEILAEGDNAYLSQFLMAFTRTFFNTTYSRPAYFLISIFLATVIALILELCISLSQMLLTVSVESFLKILGDIPALEHGKAFVNITVWLLFSILISTAGYLVTSIILGFVSNPEDIKLAFITYFFIILLLQSFTLVNPWSSLKQFVQPESAEGAKLFDGFLAILSDMIIPAVLCFVGYSLIGFICNGNFVYGDMNGLAIAVGGAFARFVKYEQCDFHGSPQASSEV